MNLSALKSYLRRCCCLVCRIWFLGEKALHVSRGGFEPAEIAAVADDKCGIRLSAAVQGERI